MPLQVLGQWAWARVTIGSAALHIVRFRPRADNDRRRDEANNGYSIPRVFDNRTGCESKRRAGALGVGFTPVEGVDWVRAWLSDDRLVILEVSVHGDS